MTPSISLYIFSMQKYLWVDTNQYQAANRGENKSAKSICTAGSFIKKKIEHISMGQKMV
jgi:hypothetical protein